MIPDYSQFAQIDHSSGKVPGLGTLRHPELWQGCVGAFAPILGQTANYWIDFSPYRHHGTRTNGLLWTNDGGYCGEFDGDNDYVELGTISTSNPLQMSGGAVSFSFWINPVKTGDSFQRIIDKSTAGNGANGYAVYLYSGYQFAIVANGSAGASVVNYVPTANEWVHVVITSVAGAAAEFYIDGFNVGRALGNAINIPNSSCNMRIGTWNHSTGREYKGKLDDVRFYNRILTGREILTLAQYRGAAYELDRVPTVFYVPVSGAISGSSSISLSTTGTLTGSGAVAGSSSVAITTTGSAGGAGSLVGSSSISIAVSGSVSGTGSLTGSSTVAIATSGTIEGAGSLSGASTVGISTSGSIAGLAGISGTSSIAIGTTGDLSGTGAITGSSTIDVSAAGSLSGSGALSGSSQLSVTTTGVLTASGAEISTGFLEYALGENRMHYFLDDEPAHFEIDEEPMHSQLDLEPLHFELLEEPLHYELQEA